MALLSTLAAVCHEDDEVQPHVLLLIVFQINNMFFSSSSLQQVLSSRSRRPGLRLREDKPAEDAVLVNLGHRCAHVVLPWPMHFTVTCCASLRCKWVPCKAIFSPPNWQQGMYNCACRWVYLASWTTIHVLWSEVQIIMYSWQRNVNFPENTRRWTNVVLMSAQRRRR